MKKLFLVVFLLIFVNAVRSLLKEERRERHVEESTHIEAPPEAVWELLSDLSRIPEYVYFVREVFDISGPADLDVVYKERAKPGLFESVSEWRITVFEPPRRQAHECAMPEMDASVMSHLEPEDGGTRYSLSMDFAVLPRIRPLGVLLENLFVRRKVQSDCRRVLGDCKRVVEADSSRREVIYIEERPDLGFSSS